ncbi:thioredoxin family protein [Candidatus Enterococcus mansonii]|uniref:Thioredoxin domain-containing protein n=1 Tax=Candidatus Enterococcus mansonii TaxID=1834181 RepID=A0ABU8IFU5_9ENTE
MKKKILFSIFIALGITGLYFSFSNITKQTQKNYNMVTYKEILSKAKQKADFILFVKKDGCIHCENVEPLVNKLAKEKKLQVLSITSNKEKQQEKLINNLKISLYPTIIFFKKGIEETRIVGEFDEQELTEKIGELKYESS